MAERITLPYQPLHTGHIADRPLSYVRYISKAYPRIWQALDAIRGDLTGILSTPEIMPAFAEMAPDDLVTGARDSAFIAGLGAWRTTQSIYAFDPTVLDAVWETPLEGTLPVALFDYLPEWCCWVPLNPPRDGLHGFFVHTDRSHGDGRKQLKLLVDVDEEGLHSMPLTLMDGGTLQDAIASFLSESSSGYELLTGSALSHEEYVATVRDSASFLTPLLSATLYLCSVTAELRPPDGGMDRPGPPELTQTKRGPRWFPPDRPRVWEVSYRLGAALRQAEGEGAPSVRASTGSRARPRPHIRRAHWHRFWTGPRSNSELRRLRLRWQSPTPVAVEDIEQLVPTVRPVDEGDAT